jgi:hypothetical protein
MAKTAVKKAVDKYLSRIPEKIPEGLTLCHNGKPKKAKEAATVEPGESMTEEEVMVWRWEMMQKKEPLLPELKKYIKHRGTHLAGVYHPLLFFQAFISFDHAALCNFIFLEKQKKLEEFRRDKKYILAVFLYERPHRLDAFLEIIKGAPDTDYWECLGGMWADTEFPSNAVKVWLNLLTSKRSKREMMMSDSDRKAFAKLPNEIKIFRGYAGRKWKGISWTLDEEKAVWFAKRFHDVHGETPNVMSGVCRKKDVIAYLNGRKEKEIVIDPDKVSQAEKLKV